MQDSGNQDKDVFDTLQGISDAVTQATRTGNYQDLSSTIQGMSQSLAESITRSAREGAQDLARAIMGSPEGSAGNGAGEYRSAYAGKYGKDTATYQKMEELNREKQAKNWGRDSGTQYFLQTRPGRNRGWGRIAFGAFGSFVFGIGTVVNLLGVLGAGLVGSGLGAGVLGVASGFCGVLTGLSIYELRKGSKQHRLINAYYEYAGIVGGNEYFYIEDLANRSGESLQQVRDNLTAMHQAGMLPYLEMDQQKTTLMLTDHSYQQYEAAEEARRMRESSENAGDGAGQDTPDEETRKILADGNAYIRRIRQINDRIPDDQPMSDKLYRLESIMKKIFARVQADPSKAGALRKLMNYYLPTTTRLLDAYADLSDSADGGENIRTTRKEIEDSMDSINDAFEKLLDDLFQDEAWDLSSDLNVMKTMMKQDGLMQDEKAGEPGHAE